MLKTLVFKILFLFSTLSFADTSVYTVAEVSCGDFNYELLSDNSIKHINLDDIIVLSGTAYSSWSEYNKKADDYSSVLVMNGTSISDVVVPYDHNSFRLNFGVKLIFEMSKGEAVSAKSLSVFYDPKKEVFNNYEFNVDCSLNKF